MLNRVHGLEELIVLLVAGELERVLVVCEKHVVTISEVSESTTLSSCFNLGMDLR